jgi:hypothetical protein
MPKLNRVAGDTRAGILHLEAQTACRALRHAQRHRPFRGVGHRVVEEIQHDLAHPRRIQPHIMRHVGCDGRRKPQALQLRRRTQQIDAVIQQVLQLDRFGLRRGPVCRGDILHGGYGGQQMRAGIEHGLQPGRLLHVQDRLLP